MITTLKKRLNENGNVSKSENKEDLNMKKKYLSIAMAAVMALSTLVGCGSEPSVSTEVKTETKQETQTEVKEAKGSVYYLNFKPEQDEAWQNLAKVYTEETGVPVTVVTAASGTYEETLMSEIDKTSAPTLFQVNGPVGLMNWKDYCYDLKDSKLYGELTSDSFALTEDGAVYAISYVIESYGIIANKTLLEQAGYKVEDINSFDKLKACAEDITARSAELGFSAFASAGMDSSSDWRFKTHLANLPLSFEYETEGITPGTVKGTYLDNYRAIWDLYINNATCDPKDLSAKTGNDAVAEMGEKKAVFYQNGSWAYADLTAAGLTDDDLVMMPIYIGVGDEANQGLCTGTENYWCVNNNASEDDINATLDFLYWVVSSETGTEAMANDMGFVIPFKNAVESKNLFVQQDNAYTADGKKPVAWNFPTMPSEEWKNVLGSALTAYAADQTDANWDAVVAAFVENWATEYNLTH